MIWIYNIGIALFTVLTKVASHFNKKAKLFTDGRKNTFKEISDKFSPTDRPIWFHFASLGEFEQGRPVLEQIKLLSPNEKIVITFFSPSGYEIRKNYAGADGVFYLPIDTAANAKKFLTLLNPKLAIFTKYEFWFHYFNQLHLRKTPLYLISGIFRPKQPFFQWYGSFNRKMLKMVTHFFVQNHESAELLSSIGITTVSVSGDTRFDRVYENTFHTRKIELVEKFCGSFPVFIAGSTWLADEKLLTSFVDKNPDWKLIIAPHEVDETHMTALIKLFPDAIRFSAFVDRDIAGEPDVEGLNNRKRILIIDNIGMLSSLYQYAKAAYIGGGFGAGIHNTLEAAAFGLPVIFGPKYDKFQEAKDLLVIGAAQSIINESELLSAFANFKANEKAAAEAKGYVEKNRGATEMIIKTIF